MWFNDKMDCCRPKRDVSHLKTQCDLGLGPKGKLIRKHLGEFKGRLLWHLTQIQLEHLAEIMLSKSGS